MPDEVEMICRLADFGLLGPMNVRTVPIEKDYLIDERKRARALKTKIQRDNSEQGGKSEVPNNIVCYQDTHLHTYQTRLELAIFEQSARNAEHADVQSRCRRICLRVQ